MKKLLIVAFFLSSSLLVAKETSEISFPKETAAQKLIEFKELEPFLFVLVLSVQVILQFFRQIFLLILFEYLRSL